METTFSHNSTVKTSSTALWAGRIISAICIIFLLFDAIGKIIKVSYSVSGSVALGIPEQTIQGIGITLFICTLVYTIPRTAVPGAVLLTGYLGGAMAIMMRAGQPVYFAFAVGVLVWLGLYLRTDKVRRLLL